MGSCLCSTKKGAQERPLDAREAARFGESGHPMGHATGSNGAAAVDGVLTCRLLYVDSVRAVSPTGKDVCGFPSVLSRVVHG